MKICTLKVTEKLLEAEKKKLTQLEIQLDEETGRGISSVDKVSFLYIIKILLLSYLHLVIAALNFIDITLTY